MKIVAARVPEETGKKMKEIPEDWSACLGHAIKDRIMQGENEIRSFIS